MNKKILAAAALAIVSGSAMADGPQLYGIMDISIANISNADISNNTLSAMSDGLWLPSVWGIKGSEDLGDGMSTHYNLESNLTATNGKVSTPLFTRASNVGLKGDFGDVTLGTQLDPIWIQSVAEQAMGVHHSGSAGIATYTNYQDPAGAYGASNCSCSVFESNWVRYDLPSIVENVKLSAGYQFGNQSGSTAGASGTYLGAVYAKNGLTVNLGAESQNNTLNTARLNRTLVGAMYSFGDFTVEAQMMRSSTSGISRNTLANGYVDANIGQAGVAYNITPKLTVGAQYVYVNDNYLNVRPTLTSISARYSLSKRTALYLQTETANPAGGQSLNVGYSPASTSTTSNASLVAVGMYHTF